MSRAAPEPNYLGGIGLMLEVAHVCPRCGKRLSDNPAASNYHLSGRGCRPAVFAALPEPEPLPAIEEEVPPVPAGRRIRDFEAPDPHPPMRASGNADLPSATTPAPAAPRNLSIPWLRPPDLGEVL
jgi:hypothetical protein